MRAGVPKGALAIGRGTAAAMAIVASTFNSNNGQGGNLGFTWPCNLGVIQGPYKRPIGSHSAIA
jgi:hypothetical protein